jgi:3-oxoacyl-[acyl-carrier protein] reductase
MGYLEDRAGLQGKVGIIVGGGEGLGRAVAVDLGKAGVRLALADKNESALEETARTIADAGGSVDTAVFDARDPEALGRFFEQVDNVYGDRLDVLVNVVGGTFHQPFADTKPSGWDAIIRTNFTWLLHATHLAIPRMRAAGAGSIINITSIEGHRAAPNFAVYSGMKAAVNNFSRTLAVELGPDNIRVNCIAPDMVPTEGMGRIGGGAPPPIVDMGSRISIPMGRRGTYDDVGGCALFLASNLSSYVTGTSVHPDGGTFASAGSFNWPGIGFTNNPPRAVVDLFNDSEN